MNDKNSTPDQTPENLPVNSTPPALSLIHI